MALGFYLSEIIQRPDFDADKFIRDNKDLIKKDGYDCWIIELPLEGRTKPLVVNITGAAVEYGDCSTCLVDASEKLREALQRHLGDT